MSAISDEYTCIREGMQPLRRVFLRQFKNQLSLRHLLTYCPQIKHKCKFQLSIAHHMKYFQIFSILPSKTAKGPIFPIIKIYFVYFSYVSILARQLTPIAPRFSSPEIAEVGSSCLLFEDVLLFLFVDLYSCLLTMMSIFMPSNAFLVLMRFATFLLQVCITSYISIYSQRESIVLPGAAWR